MMFAPQEPFQLLVAGRFVLFAAFFVQPHPAVLPFREVILDIHLQHRGDAGEGLNHDADQRLVAQADGRDSPAFLLRIWPVKKPKKRSAAFSSMRSPAGGSS